MTSKRKLYALPGCPFGHRAAFAMREKELEFELTLYDMKKRPAELDAIGPRAKSPTLFDDDVTVYDSSVVLEYIEDRYPARPLMPNTPALRARARMLMTQANEELGPKFGALLHAWFAPSRDPEAVRAAEEGVNSQLSPWERACDGKKYLLGDELSLADIVLYTPFAAWRNLSGFEPPPQYARLREWIERMSARPTSAPLMP